MIPTEAGVYMINESGKLVFFNATGGQKKSPITVGSLMSLSSATLSSTEYQAYPDQSCLVLPPTPPGFTAEAVGSTTAEIEIRPFQPASFCTGVSLPPTKLAVKVQPTNPLTACSGAKPQLQSTFSSNVQFENLCPDTEYIATVGWSNFYTPEAALNGTSKPRAPTKSFKTTVSDLEGPTGITVESVYPDGALISWLPASNNSRPLADLSYSVAVYIQDNKRLVHESAWITCPSGSKPCKSLIQNLTPNTEYAVHVNVRFKSETASATSPPRPVKTLTGPTDIKLQNVSAKEATISWASDAQAVRCLVKYTEAGTSAASWKNQTADSSGTTAKLTGLSSAKQYEFRLVCLYGPGGSYSYETTSAYFASEGHEPLRPDSVVFNGSEIVWDPPSNGGFSISGYILEYRKDPNSPWTNVTLYGDVKHWRPPISLHLGTSAEVRIAAMNTKGMGPFSRPVQLSTATGSTSKWTTVAGVIAAFCLVAVLGTIGGIYYWRRKKAAKRAADEFVKRRLPMDSNSVSRAATVPADNSETLRHLPEAEIKALPHVSRNYITIARLLGRGAFGEVYEGLACNLPRVGPKTLRVAVKTLKEGSTDIERVKFLKEAILMSNFQHPNIVRLLGVCIESEPHWLILELMEGGDLQTYLRSVRPSDHLPSQVSLQDLVSIALDVAKGCEYLEQQHHVHRDLAARNCLISTRNSQLRTVKIADFGLARDVYEGDYYRVEGHGLLPVRWMAPESMIDAVFTLKSDVWSFGILLWEIMTLGQQPYPGRTNWDVLNFVRIGGQLDAPDFCPEQIHEVMLSCWAYSKDDRPTFAEARAHLEMLSNDPQLGTDCPFPPTRPKAGYVDSEHGSASIPKDGPPVTSARNLKVAPSVPSLTVSDAEERTSQTSSRQGSHGGGLLRSFRREPKQPPKPPPSKERLDDTIRPDSGVSAVSGASAGSSSNYASSPFGEGYEMPLIKPTAVTNTQLLKQQPVLAHSSSPSSSPKTFQNRTGDAQGVVNKAFEPTSPPATSSTAPCKAEPLPELESSPRSLPRNRMNNKYVPSPTESFTRADKTKPVLVGRAGESPRSQQQQQQSPLKQRKQLLQRPEETVYATVDVGSSVAPSALPTNSAETAFSTTSPSSGQTVQQLEPLRPVRAPRSRVPNAHVNLAYERP